MVRSLLAQFGDREICVTNFAHRASVMTAPFGGHQCIHHGCTLLSCNYRTYARTFILADATSSCTVLKSKKSWYSLAPSHFGSRWKSSTLAGWRSIDHLGWYTRGADHPFKQLSFSLVGAVRKPSSSTCLTLHAAVGTAAGLSPNAARRPAFGICLLRGPSSVER